MDTEKKYKKFSLKELIKKNKPIDSIYIEGWVRTKRAAKHVIFVQVNDGSILKNLQVVIDPNQFSEDTLKKITTGASVRVEGNLTSSLGVGQSLELKASNLIILGEADPDEYPLQPKKHSMEFLREIAHLRLRTNTFGAVFRIRHAISFAIHSFLNKESFFWMHTPIITGADAEGAGEMFQVTNLDMEKLPKEGGGLIDYKKDFFNQKTNLTVSGQLEAETGALALGKVYTFGPTFRAENSNTSRHLAEFWMIEPEMAFYDLNMNMVLAEKFLKYLANEVLINCEDDLKFLNDRWVQMRKGGGPKGETLLPPIPRLESLVGNAFISLSYTDAHEILKQSKPNKKGKFQYPIETWGQELQSEHERFLVENHFKKPVIIRDYPKECKAFYMRQNEDKKTVAAMDILLPGLGEVIGGSQREERLDLLKQRMEEMDIDQHELYWYLDTRRFGSIVHSGFGLGLERFVQFVTGMENIRDVIPFPRVPGNASF